MILKNAAPKHFETDIALGELLERSLRGDEAAYREFLENAATILKQYFVRSSFARNSEQQIDDVIQDVLLTIHQKRDLYRTGMPVSPWIRAIAKFRMLDCMRAEARNLESSVSDQELDAILQQGAEDSPVDLEKLLLCLDKRQREILILAKVDGLPHAEIACKFGMSLASVKISVHRSLNLLRKAIYEKN